MRCSYALAVFAFAACGKQSTAADEQLVSADQLREHMAEFGCRMDYNGNCSWHGPCGCQVNVEAFLSGDRTRALVINIQADNCDENKLRAELPRWVAPALSADDKRAEFRAAMQRPSFAWLAPEPEQRAHVVEHFDDVVAEYDWRPQGGSYASPAFGSNCPRGKLTVTLSKRNTEDVIEIDSPEER